MKKEINNRRSLSKKGEKNGMFGKHLSKETKRKISNTLKKYVFTEEHKKNIRKGLEGKTIIGMSGKKHSKKTKQKMSLTRTGKKLYKARKKWKDLNYRAKHKRINRDFNIANKCENINCKHKSKSYEWANLSGTYLEDRSDWMMMCRSCHSLYDKGKIK